MSFTNIIELCLLYACMCKAQQSTIQNDEKGFDYLGASLKGPDANGYEQLQHCTSIWTEHGSAMCSGADWWKRDKWSEKRIENQHPQNADVFNETERAANSASTMTGWLKNADHSRKYPPGVCHEKPGLYLKIPGSRNQARWFAAKSTGESCRNVCAEASADSQFTNGEILAFDPVSMAHGASKLHINAHTYSHVVVENLPGADAYNHFYTWGGTQYPKSHIHFEAYNPQTASVNGASGHGPFAKKQANNNDCNDADDFGNIYGNNHGRDGFGFMGDNVNGCMDWEGDRVGNEGSYSLNICTCRDSYMDADGKYLPIDVHDNTSSYGRQRLKEANEWYNESRSLTIDWDNQIQNIETTSSYYQATIENPPSGFREYQKIVPYSPAPELQLAYYCECPHGTHGKNCELTTNFCDHSDGSGHSHAPCVAFGWQTFACIHVDGNSTHPSPHRQCQCMPGYTGPTCAVKDMCHPIHGDNNCVHGTCMHESVREHILPSAALPIRVNYLALQCSVTDRLIHHGSDPNSTCTDFAAEGGCIYQESIGQEECCKTCRDVQLKDTEWDTYLADTQPAGRRNLDEGQLTVAGQKFTCNCFDNWAGADCSVVINECLTNPCDNEGTKMDESGQPECTQTVYQNSVDDPTSGTHTYGHKCTCKEDYSGKDCTIRYIDGETDRAAAEAHEAARVVHAKALSLSIQTAIDQTHHNSLHFGIEVGFLTVLLAALIAAVFYIRKLLRPKPNSPPTEPNAGLVMLETDQILQAKIRMPRLSNRMRFVK